MLMMWSIQSNIPKSREEHLWYPWNPKDPCFGGKRPRFWGLTFKNRGHLGSRSTMLHWSVEKEKFMLIYNLSTPDFLLLEYIFPLAPCFQSCFKHFRWNTHTSWSHSPEPWFLGCHAMEPMEVAYAEATMEAALWRYQGFGNLKDAWNWGKVVAAVWHQHESYISHSFWQIFVIIFGASKIRWIWGGSK